MKKTGKEPLQKYLKKGDFWPDQYEISKMMNMQLTNQRMKKTAKNFQPRWTKSSFQNLEKTLWGRGDIQPTPHPTVHPRVKTGYSTPVHSKPTSNLIYQLHFFRMTFTI